MRASNAGVSWRIGPPESAGAGRLLLPAFQGLEALLGGSIRLLRNSGV
jgi:hypothetical protein